ncbi:hypothetical protein D3C80_1390440 [compost metagenome]
MATDIVCLIDLALSDYDIERSCVVLYVKPVAYLISLAIDRKRLAFQRVENYQRDQLLGEVKRPVIVGAVGDDCR